MDYVPVTMSSTTVETVEPKPKSSAKMRKRAPKACLSCRSRKVRCDVSQRGRPCMNCYLDNETCVVTGRASRLRGQRGENDNSQVSYPPYAGDECAHGRTSEDVVNSRTGGQMPSARAEEEHDHSSRDAPDLMNQNETQTVEIDVDRWTATGLTATSVLNDQRGNRIPSPPPIIQEATTIPLNTFNSFTSPEIPLWVGDQRIAMNADVTYSYYPFIKTGNLHNIMPQDVNYLESQGCLRVPTRAILDEFVQQYFLHIHPIMPILNEGDFWDMYCNPSSGSTDKISLVFLQGLLFSSCNFISKSSIKALGFPNIRTARATFYRRTKLLFDFDTETSLVDLAQTALLLSFWATNWSLAAKKLNSTWLGIAIQNAKSSDAHLYAVKQNYSAITDPVQHKKQNILKRLWWCCLIRDRILALGVRRSLQISRAHFDLDANPGLGYTDLADEVDRSKVYNAETKRCLIEIFVQLGELCSVLTDLVTLVFPLDDVPGWDRELGSEGTAKLKECKAALRRWYKATTLRFPRLCGGNTPRMTNAQNQLQHDSVILYTNLMYMHYHSARAALCHHEVLQLAVACTSPNLSSNLREFSNIYENRHELQDAACSVTECLKELLQLRLVRWLPISAVACTALPLVLHIIDVKLSSQNKTKPGNTADSDPHLAAKQHRLNILIEAMKTYQPQYDGVDYISETIRHIINLAQLDAPASAGGGISGLRNDGKQANISDWTDILASQPGYYLRLAMTMDLCFSKGRLVEESDFPANLRGLFAADFSSIRALVAGRKAAAQNQGSYFMPNPTANIIPGTVRSLSSDEESNSPDSLQGGTTNNPVNPNSNPNQTSDPRHHPHLNPPSTNEVDMSGMSGMFNIDNLASEVLAAWGADAVDPDQPMCYEGQGEDDWIERAWSDEEINDGGHGQMHGQIHNQTPGQGPGQAQMHDQSSGPDKEAARVLLDALRDDGVSCGV
ncbi:fungal-specific transcription factor domain-containing protein [Hypoxylon trugodes]|uniref:fungal-specific transcription factor domain-containing protein n=1 Tax=Hypoxylon trugodes TaxID=326681 RepID=UPI002196531B|nr:fungal-specific transcription factor domain-containing protein [Hypoxylon trugodes]KAI1392693.1 fungal-specific transcription factor domain-containing protein [Hypoxylon trugodes]